eukprot:gene8714-11775_t
MDVITKKSVTFFAIGDFGCPTPEVRQTAWAMADYATNIESPEFILALGDNFYPCGVQSVNDPLFKSYWMDVFLKYDKLRVPWRVVLGNHDYEGNAQAQIDFTYHKSNPNRIWYCPSNNYEFIEIISGCSEDISIEFFAFDANGCQNDMYASELLKTKDTLRMKLLSSTAKWKIVYAHHPMYTKGRWHGEEGKLLRDNVIEQKIGKGDKQKIETVQGFGMEDIFVEGGVDAYICGHEHVFQHHIARGINHFVAGAAGYTNTFYGGSDKYNNIDWVDSNETDGFLAITVSEDEMIVKFIKTEDQQVLREVIIRK